MNKIPKTARQRQHDTYAEQAGIKKLEPFSDFMLIDGLAKQYPAYTHDDIFDLEVSFVLQLIFTNRYQAFINERTNEIEREMNKPNK